MPAYRILLVYPEFPISYWGFQYAMELFGKKAMHPPLCLITVAALCPQDWEFRLVDLNIQKLTDDDILWADMVFISAMTAQLESLHEVLHRCRGLNRTSVVGGALASGCPELVEGRADVLVLGEAEVTLKPFLEDLDRGALRCVYRSDEKPDISSSPVPRYDLLNLDAYGVIDVQYSRGCPFNCEFCDIVSLYGRKPRSKNPARIILEFNAIYELGYRGLVFIVDDNFIGSMKSAEVLLDETIRWQREREYPFNLMTEASVNLADNDRLMEKMRLAGFKRVFVGIETPSLESLRESRKYQNVYKDLAKAVTDIVDAGMEVSGGFIVGFDNDHEDIFDRQIEFIERAGIPWAMVGVLVAIPGTRLWTRLEKEGRLLWHAVGDQFGRPNFRTRLDAEILSRGYRRILETIYAPDAYYGRVVKLLERQAISNHPNLHLKSFPPSVIAGLAYKCLTVIGIRASYRWSFWKYMARIVRKCPSKWLQALAHAVIGHHFILYTDELLAGHCGSSPAGTEQYQLHYRDLPQKGLVDGLGRP